MKSGKVSRVVNRIKKDDRGFTGLEAAIILIAFVTVAAVFSYVILGAGFFTTQKSKKVIATGVKQASSSLTLDGQYIYLNCSTPGSNGKVDKIYFYVTQTAGGSPVDLNKTSIKITTSKGYKQLFYDESNCIPGTGGSNCAWWYECIIGDDDNVVELNEKYKIVINVTSTVWSSAIGELNPNEKITIEVCPPVGASLSITKTLPPSFTNITYV